MAEKVQRHVVYRGPTPAHILRRNGGVMPCGDVDEDMHSFCAWYFARCAHKALIEIPDQVSLEGDTDTTVRLRTILDSIMQVYGLDDIEKLMKFMPYARQQAFKMGLTWNSRFQAWLDSGGRSYDEVTREPPKD